MTFGVRTPSLKKSLKARTTGKLKRSIKRSITPGDGMKGAGWIKNPKKAAYNAAYSRTTTSLVKTSSRANTRSNTRRNKKTQILPSNQSFLYSMENVLILLFFIVSAITMFKRTLPFLSITILILLIYLAIRSSK